MSAPFKITTTSNYKFLNNSYREARKGIREEQAERERLGDLTYLDDSRLRGIGLEGGSRSGKTWDMSVFICEYVNTFSGKIILICRDSLATLKKTTYQTLKKVWGLYHGNTRPFNKSATPIEYNGNTIFFSGVNEDSMLAHGLETDVCWVNESMNCREESVMELIRRCTEFYVLDYNPSAVKSWCFDMERRKSHKIHRSTALTNPYCPPNSRAEILGYEPTHPDDRHLPEKDRRPHPTNVAEGTADFYMWQVYGLGLRGKSEDLILPNYELFDDEPKEYDWCAYGGDFGTIAPTTLVKVWRVGNAIYAKEMFSFYEHDARSQGKIYNVALADKIKSLGLEKKLQVWDSADTKAIIDLRLQGITSAVSARKGKDSVWNGLKRLRSSKIFIHRDSVEMINEMDGYVWQKRLDGEFVTNSSGHREPMKRDDHRIDAMRYVDSFHFFKK